MALEGNEGGDGGEPIGDAGGAGGSLDGHPSEGDGGLDLDSIVAGVEADLLGDPSNPAADGDGDGTGDGSGGASDPLDLHIQKNYGGDKEAFLAAQYTSRSENTRLRERVEEMERKLTESSTPKRDPEAEFQAEREADATVRAIDHDIQSVDSEIKQINARQQAIFDEAGPINKEIAQLEGKLETAQPEDIAQIRYQIIQKKTELVSLTTEFNGNKRDIANKRSLRTSFERELSRADRDVKSRLSAKEARVADETYNAHQTNANYDSAFSETIKLYNVDVKGEDARYLYNSTKSILRNWLEEREAAGEPGLDREGMANAVRSLMKSAATAFKIQLRGRGTGRPPAPRPVVPPQSRRSVNGKGGVAVTPRTPGSAPPRNRDELLSDPDSVRRRADAIFEAAARANSGRSGGRF